MKDKLVRFLRAVLLVIIIVCVLILGKRFYDYYVNIQNNKHIEEVINDISDSSDHSSETEEEKFLKREAKNLKILKALQEENSDVVGFLEVPGINVAYPVLKGPDNDYYLRKGLNKKYDLAGSIFVDANNESDFSDDNTVMYGHHLDEMDTMFTKLDKYRDQEFAEKNRQIYITTNEGLREYQIFAVFGVPSDYDYRTLDFAYPEEKISYFDKLKSVSEVSLETRDFTDNDTIITLSTCEYDYEDQRLAVQAVRIK